MVHAERRPQLVPEDRPALPADHPQVLGVAGSWRCRARRTSTATRRADIELYLQGKSLTGPERVRLFKLAFDASISGFSGRQSLYEYFFFGDPVRMAGALVNSYDREPVRARVREFLEPRRLTAEDTFHGEYCVPYHTFIVVISEILTDRSISNSTEAFS